MVSNFDLKNPFPSPKFIRTFGNTNKIRINMPSERLHTRVGGGPPYFKSFIELL